MEVGRNDDRTGEDGAVGRRGFSRRTLLKGSVAAGVIGANLSAFADAVGATTNTITAENALPGNPSTEWESWRSENIVGFASPYSVLPGEQVAFRIKTSSTNYRVKIYRMGWYGGAGARLVATVNPSASLPQAQPAPLTDAATGLIDCGNWAVSATWTVPTTAVSGVYYALFERLDVANEDNYTLFVVRRPTSAPIVVQTSETTWHAYNRFGGKSLYWGDDGQRAVKVSYNRPLGDGGEHESSFFAQEYTLVRFLERNGYDVSYCANVDTHLHPEVPGSATVFVSSGHDEYWSGEMRQHVEAARDAGTSLIFFSGNEVFWKIRYEPSIAAGAAAARTVVCYKETLDNAKVDPSPQWTGTWRDGRFSPPSDGGRPENSLTGQLFRAILPVGQPDLTITVPAEYGSLRFWRNTAVAALLPGQTAWLAPNSLGYEFDVDADNGFRPAGLIHLSETSASSDEVLQDNGGTYRPGTVTHHLSLYRAASGALVFGAGTVQWAYGLDSYHGTDPGSPTDQSMKQATVNLLADMGVQPSTLEPGLAVASPIADAAPPTSTITLPLGGTTLPLGAPVTVTGTAVDAGGGRVAAVEVSTDGGATWHPATGRESWSYVFTPLQSGPTVIRSRAVDDSVRMEVPSTGISVEVGGRELPCSIWPVGIAPAVPDANDGSPIEVGVRFSATQDGFVTGVRFYKSAANTGTHVAHVWTPTGVLLATATFSNETASGWQTVSIPPVTVTAGTPLVASVFMPNGHYAADSGYFNQSFELAPLRALANGDGGGNGLYLYGASGFPTSSYGASNYWVDIVFDDDNFIAPTVIDTSPGAGLDAVSPGTVVTATFSEAVQAGSIVMGLIDDAGTPVAGVLWYDSATARAVFTPEAALTPSRGYTATVSAATDQSGTPLAGPHSWTFRTAGVAGSSPATLWDTSAAPAAIAVGDTAAVELGVRFLAAVDGSVTALRYYKGSGSVGLRIGHLWDAAGNLLATAAFDAESSSGWQQMNLTTPVPLVAGAEYVVSYFAPNGAYAYTGGYFSGPHERAPLSASASTSVVGNGVYRYGASSFPTNSYGASNYWVDLVFAVAPDTTGPTVVDVEPAPGLIAVAPAGTVRVTFNEAIEASSIAFNVTDGAGPIGGAVAYDAQRFTATFTPAAPMAPGSEVTVSVSAADLAGNVLSAPLSWAFRSDIVSGTLPATLWDTAALPAVPAANDPAAVEVGVRVTPGRDGVVTGIRFYKGPGNEGPHVGRFWTTDGTQLASVSFGPETTVGWQQAMFAQPVPVVGGTSYVASYLAPVGRYAVTGGYFSGASAGADPLVAGADVPGARNGLYRYGGGFPDGSYNAANYWVDVIYDDRVGPKVIATVPAGAATEVPAMTAVTAQFSEAILPDTASLTLLDAQGATVGGTTSYDNVSRTLAFVPSAPLLSGASYTATVSGAIDGSGNGMTAPLTWSFTVVAATTVSIWSAASGPDVASVNDPSPIELGVRWRSAVDGSARGVRFYKGPTNTGVHTGHLWTADGTLLATVQFTGESATGWQQAAFSSPVAVTANTVYVVSYHTTSGNYAYSGNAFASPVTNGVLEALGNAEAGGNGVYRYGADSGFPTAAYGASNYWVDVLFQPA